MSRGMIVTQGEDWLLPHPSPLTYILTPSYSSTSRCPTPCLSILVRLIGQFLNSYSHWLDIFTCLLFLSFPLTHGPTCIFPDSSSHGHVTLLKVYSLIRHMFVG